MKTIKQFFKIKETYIGIAAALAFQLIFFTVWLTAYDGVYDRTDQLKIAVINDDEIIGKTIVEELKSNSQFKFTLVEDFKKTQDEMDQRKWQMIIHIPNTFSTRLHEGKTAEINYYINQSAPSLSKQMMEATVNKMSTTINSDIYKQRQQELGEQISKTVENDIANQELILPYVENMSEEILQKLNTSDLMKPIVTKTNNVEGFAATMIPLMVVLASFIGAMVMSQQLQFTHDKLKATTNHWALFFTRQMINLIVTVILSVLTLLIVYGFNIDLKSSLINAWLFQSILFFSFISISQLFVVIFGHLGMVFNIILTATQLVSSGAIVPRELLGGFYQQLGQILPATYGTNGYFSLIYGGGNLITDMYMLIIIIIGSLIISIGGIVFKVSLLNR